MLENAELEDRLKVESGGQSHEQWELLHAYRISHDIPHQRREDNDGLAFMDWKPLNPK
jgi:hypothetical protein